jgi:nucleoside 2-deoxyribosyltransferase
MPDEQGRPFVYLAGPDVFFPDAVARGEHLKTVVAARGMVGLFPLDNDLDPAAYPNRQALAIAIARANEVLMRRADVILANIQPWRGVEADDGTAYEIGFMASLGKLIVLYTSDPRTFGERIRTDVYGGRSFQDGPYERGASDGMMIEDFGLADNLMLINAAVNTAKRAFGHEPNPAVIVSLGFVAGAEFALRLWQAWQANGVSSN